MFFSLRTNLNKSLELLDSLEGIKLFCNISSDDHKFLLSRKESLIENTEIKNFLKHNNFSLSFLVKNIDTLINSLNDTLPENMCKCTDTLEDFYDYWESFLVKTIKPNKQFYKKIDSMTLVVKEWQKYYSNEEDRGTESSYSDYSGNDTSSSSDTDECSSDGEK